MPVVRPRFDQGMTGESRSGFFEKKRDDEERVQRETREGFHLDALRDRHAVLAGADPVVVSAAGE